jgi:hypothetical protein
MATNVSHGVERAQQLKVPLLSWVGSGLGDEYEIAPVKSGQSTAVAEAFNSVRASHLLYFFKYKLYSRNSLLRGLL